MWSCHLMQKKHLTKIFKKTVHDRNSQQVKNRGVNINLIKSTYTQQPTLYSKLKD